MRRRGDSGAVEKELHHEKIILLGLTALLGACQSMNPAAKASLDGEVFYLQRIALPPTATLSVSLQDVS